MDRATQLAGRLEGTADTIEAALEAFDWGDDVTAEEAEEGLLNLPSALERCRGCDWWYESSMLVSTEDDDAEDGYCDDCRDDADND